MSEARSLLEQLLVVVSRPLYLPSTLLDWDCLTRVVSTWVQYSKTSGGHVTQEFSSNTCAVSTGSVVQQRAIKGASRVDWRVHRADRIGWGKPQLLSLISQTSSKLPSVSHHDRYQDPRPLCCGRHALGYRHLVNGVRERAPRDWRCTSPRPANRRRRRRWGRRRRRRKHAKTKPDSNDSGSDDCDSDHSNAYHRSP